MREVSAQDETEEEGSDVNVAETSVEERRQQDRGRSARLRPLPHREVDGGQSIERQVAEELRELAQGNPARNVGGVAIAERQQLEVDD
jgi:hypothetical protein